MTVPMSEAVWQSRVMGTARVYGWRCVHVRPARTATGWRTPYEGDTGLPDLILAKDGVVLLVELKTDKGKVTVEQAKWVEAASPYGQVWRPRHWVDVCAILKGDREAEMGV